MRVKHILMGESMLKKTCVILVALVGIAFMSCSNPTSSAANDAAASASGFTISPATLSVAIGATSRITISQQATFKSEDTTIASVDAGGNVTGVKIGSTKITVTSAKNEVKTCAVTVTAVSAVVSSALPSSCNGSWGLSAGSGALMTVQDSYWVSGGSKMQLRFKSGSSSAIESSVGYDVWTTWSYTWNGSAFVSGGTVLVRQ